jgi:peptidoglycan hydrolase-like protein with peptidoglycan-binding domain
VRILQVSREPGAALLVGYLCPPVKPPGGVHVDEQLRAALPGVTIVCYPDADGEPLEQTIARAKQAGHAGDGPTCLAGYSAGCLRGVRQRLRDGADPDAILAIDGTHTSMPPAPWQLDVWRPFIAAARRGEKLVVITCSQQTYTENLPSHQRFQSTLNVARTLTGLALVQPGPLPHGEEHVAGGLRVHNYASKTIDGPAHSQQLTHVLPEMVRRHLAPWLAGHAGAATAATVPATLTTLARGMRGDEVSAWQARLNELGFDCGATDGIFGQATHAATRALQTRASLPATGIVDERTRDAAREALPPTEPRIAPGARLGEALLAAARADLGVREERTNDGARIREYFAGTGVTPPAHWCAAALRFWLRAAARAAGVTAPIAGSVGAKATMAQLQAAHRWITADDLRREPARLRPGQIVVWHRGAPGAYTGHIGVVATVSGRSFTTIEGNSGAASNAVATMARSLADVNLLGCGFVD